VPIISVLERKTATGRLIVTAFYFILGLGGITMVYPFLLMLRLSTADMTDNTTLEVIPSFWHNQDSLAKKYELKRYYGTSQNPYAPEVTPDFAPMPGWGPEWLVSNYGELKNFWRTYFSPFEREPVSGQIRQVSDYRQFLSTLPPLDFYTVDWDVDPDFHNFNQYLQQILHVPKSVVDSSYLVRPDASIRDWHPHPDGSYQLSLQYKAWTKPGFRRPLYPAWVSFLKARYGQFDVTKLNAAYGTHYKYWTELRFPLFEPKSKIQETDYREFVANDFPHIWTHILGNHDKEWVAFLVEDQHIREPNDWKRLTGLNVGSVSAIPFPADLPLNEGWALMWSRFVHTHVPIQMRELRSPDRLYVEFLQQKYGSLSAVNQSWQTTFRNFGEIPFAEGLSDYRTLIEESLRVKTALTLEPYEVALSFLSTQSTAILNTVWLMILALTAALTINPLAAYSLSRFRLKGSHKILLFILATMALPAEIAMVPSFLLVKNLGLMNNYLALILPGAASAFGIFLLKGFFDSLPSELYEAATLDGAKELTIFARITIPLATPILAVTGMAAVLGAYGSFISAILYLPNQDLWPIMPRLFSMSTQHDIAITYGVNMAALVIGSVPTFLVFLFAQRQIMRGIVLPTFK
jgi:ABC-type glycerol-3-phosphate transport system permease component